MSNSPSRHLRAQDIIVPCFVIIPLIVALVTLPAALMDLLLSASIALSVVILMTTFFIRKPLEFSIFPTLLLMTTLFRLTLNVATTRLILTRAGEEGELAAGQVINSFSSFVTGENLVVGIVIFILFIVIQFIVITKGATRISEVAARFTLDAMPGRQMTIDADLNAGFITPEQARKLRSELTEQSDFFGAMDGAGKFIRGDAIASIVITFVNILGGLFIGVVQQKMNLTDALALYTTLTIGDGLVSQIPALLISLSTGILITRSREEGDLPKQVMQQIFFRPEALIVTACFLVILSITGLPAIPLLTIATGLLLTVFILSKNRQKEELAEKENQTRIENERKSEENERIENYLTIDPIELELGVGLLPFAEAERKEEFIAELKQIRRQIASELGILIPKIRVRDNLSLDENQYRIQIDGETAAEAMVYPNLLLAKETDFSRGSIPGLMTTFPADGSKAFWIETRNKDRSEEFGYEIIVPKNVVFSHLREVLYREAEHFLTRDAVKHLIDELHEAAPAVVDELMPKFLSLSQIQLILRIVLRERVSIRALGNIFEVLGDNIAETNNPYLLAEEIRHRLARTICSRLRDPDKILHVLLCPPQMERIIQEAVTLSENGISVHLSPEMAETLHKAIRNEIVKFKQLRQAPVILTSPEIRFALREITCSEFPLLNILSFKEISRDTKVQSEGMLIFE